MDMNVKKLMGVAGLCGIISLPVYAVRDRAAVEASVEVVDISLLKKELKELRKKDKLQDVTATDKEVQTALTYAKLLFLTRTDKSTVTGRGILEGKLEWQNVRDLGKTIRALSFEAYKQGGEAKEILFKLLDYLSSQNIYDRIPPFRYSNYNDIRKVPLDFLSAASVCKGERLEKLLEGVLNILEWDIVRSGDGPTLEWISSDYLYNAIPHVFKCIAYNPNMEQAVKDMKLFGHFLSICTTYNPGGRDILKPDGTGFHHKTHYNGYMYSYRTWVDYMYLLKGTSFRISEEAYLRMRKAVVSEYLMAVCAKEDKGHIFGNSMAGRHPFTGMEVTFSKDSFKKLVEIGGDVMGTELDKELAAYFNAFFQTDFYKGIEPAGLDGFYQFNYSPAGVYRMGDWVAVMRCPTTNFWGGEIYNKTNRFGRYQAHGTLEVLYEGGLERSGYPFVKSKKGAGWDWNMMPGSTTVHYGDWKAMMPARNVSARFDQWSKTTDFAGALSAGEYGLFAAVFDQNDNWGNQRFKPTGLTFGKSVLAIDGMLFSIGSGISSKGDYPEWITATNLFQNVVKKGGELVVNGQEVEKENSLLVLSEEPCWMVTPSSTGYYVPAGHDSLVVRYGVQETPASDGPETSLDKELVAKAYLNHGVKTAGKGYRFLVVPSVDKVRMANIAKRYEAGELFETLVQQDSLHIVSYKPSSVMAYSFFAPADGLNVGNVVGSATELLVLERMEGDEMQLDFCNPNLRPLKDKKKNWVPMPTEAVLELKGQWEQLSSDSEVVLQQNEVGNTFVKSVLKEGFPVHLRLKKK